ALFTGEGLPRARDGGGGRFGPFVGRDQLAGAETGERGAERLGRTLFQVHAAGREIARRHAARAAHLASRGEHVGAAGLEQRFLGERAGGDEADDVARDERFRTAALLRL